jgi:hypothetical protein
MTPLPIEPFRGLLLVGLGLALGWQAAHWRVQHLLGTSARSMGDELHTIDRQLRRDEASILRQAPYDCGRLIDGEERVTLRRLEGAIELLRALQGTFDRGTDAGWLRDSWKEVSRTETAALWALRGICHRDRWNPAFWEPHWD